MGHAGITPQLFKDIPAAIKVSGAAGNAILLPMTEAELLSKLTIAYSFAETPLGQVLLANTEKGICRLVFETDKQLALSALQAGFPGAVLREAQTNIQIAALAYFANSHADLSQLCVHLPGTPFQIKIWEALLTLPFGAISNYQTLARQAGQAGAARAAGTAIGSNPVACLIPCHRVVTSAGGISGYRWGVQRKQKLLAWEQTGKW